MTLPLSSMLPILMPLPRSLVGLFLLLLAAPCALAQSPSPFLGDWMTYDETGEPEAVVRLQVRGGEVEGRITRLVPPPGAAGYGCDGCHGGYAGRDVRELQLVHGLTFRRGALRGGTLIDFETGESYGCQMTLGDDGTLRVRVYEGVPALGVTDVWHRVR